jgi:hypothetical protein
MSRLLKFLHTMGAIGMMGSLAALAVMQWTLSPVTALAAYSSQREAMAVIANWLFMPSLGATLISGLLAIAVNRGFHNAGWAWVKAISGILLFESGFIGVAGPMRREAENSVKAVGGQFSVADLATTLPSEARVLWMLLAIATANVVLGVWRPRLLWRPR